MDYLNHVNLKDVINNLNDIRRNLIGIGGNQLISHTFVESLCNDSIDTLDKIINKQLINLIPNTIFAPLYVDIYAFKYTLEEFGQSIDNVEIEYEYNDGEISDIYFPKDEILNCILKVYYSHYAMDGNGYHVGYENVLFTFQGINRMELGLTTGYPGNLSSWVINPTEFDVTILDLPNEDIIEYNNHDDDCEIFKDDDGNEIDTDIIKHDDVSQNCSCGLIDNWNGYYPPDNDFFYSEMENIVHYIMNNNKLPDATFDNETSTWNIANQISYKFK